MTWKEKRYIIADEGLRDFILICYRALDLVWKRMDYVHHHYRLRPKHIWTKTIRKSYIDWYKLVYGRYRRIAEDFLRYNKSSPRYKNLDKKDLQVICDLEYKFKKKVLSSLDKQILENFNMIWSEKYAITRYKYMMVVEPLLQVCFPNFLRDLLRIK